MMQSAWISLAIDLGLLVSLVFFGLRMVRSSGPRVNLGRMAELEGSLRALLREAEAGSRALTDQLLKRQKDLEKLLFDLESTSGRLNRQITDAEERKGQLEVLTSRATSFLRSGGEPPRSSRSNMPVVAKSEPVEPLVERRRSDKRTVEEFAQAEVEPPSFQTVIAPVAATPPEAAPERTRLSEQIERVVTPEVLPTPQKPKRKSAVERALENQAPSVAQHAREARERARELQQNSALAKAPAPAAEEPMRSSVLSAEEAATATQQDPRLGVLSGAQQIRRQVQVL